MALQAPPTLRRHASSPNMRSGKTISATWSCRPTTGSRDARLLQLLPLQPAKRVVPPGGGGADWLPFDCPAVAEALDHARDAQDRMFLNFLAQNYCAR